MRKRQWKKILSVVLALAMVFSMNVSAFADEVTDPVAVEEPAAEQPVAEAPAEEPAPAAEEPAPAAEEPEETPAPVEEEEPAKGEEAAGGATTQDILGWTFGYDDGNPEDAPSLDGTTVTVSYAGTTITETADSLEMTLKSNGTGTATITATPGDFYVINQDESVVEANGAALATTDNTTGIQVKAVGTGEALVVDVDYEIDKTADDKWVVKDKDATANIEYAVTDTEPTGAYTGDLDETGIEIDSTNDTIFIRRKAVKAASEVVTTKPSEATDITYVPAPAPDPEGTFTVSGFKFEIDPETTVSSMTYAQNVGEVKFEAKPDKKALVNVKSAGAQQALSINLTDGVTLAFDTESDQVTDFSDLSIKGTGTVLINDDIDKSSAVLPKAFEKFSKDILISGNGASEHILISANVAGKSTYIPVFAGEDEGVKLEADGTFVAVPLDYEFADGYTTQLPEDNHLFGTSSAKELLSSNKVDFTHLAAGTNLTASDNRIEGTSVKYGEKLIYFADGAKDTLAGATVIDVPEKSTSLWLNRFIPGMESSSGIDVSRDTDQYIYVDEDGELDEEYGSLKYTYYMFTLSSNLSGEKDAANWQAGSVIDEDFNGNPVEANKKYALYTYRKATSKEYKSDVVKVCEFTTLKTTSVSIGLVSTTVSPSYIGDADTSSKLEKLADRTDVVNAKFFNFKLNGFEEGLSVVDGYEHEAYNNNDFTVVDPDGFKVGTLTVNFGQYLGGYAPTDITWNDSLKYYSLGAANDGKEKHYAARVSFIPDGDAPTQYTKQDLTGNPALWGDDLWKSGVVSFNVIPAPVRVEPDIQSPAVSGQAITTRYKATNKITGQAATLGGAPLYLFNGQRTNDVSWNNAGKSVFPAGTHTVTVSGEGLTATNYEIDPKKNAAVEFGSQELKIVDPDGTDGLKVTGILVDTVYYGTTAAGVKAALSTNFTFGGVGINKGTDRASNADKIKLLASESSNVVAATELTDTEKVSANTTIYAYYIDAVPTTTGYTTLKASSNAIPIKIQPRKVYVSLKEGEFKTKRGEDLISKVSSNKLVVKVQGAAPNYVSDKVPMPAGVDGDKFFVGTEIALNTTGINKNVPKNYNDGASIAGYTISSDFAQNYEVSKYGDVFDYTVDGRYWVKYILEYGGQGAKTGKRYVSEDVIDVDDVNFGVTTKNIKPSSKIANPSWNGVLAEGDEITGWQIKQANDLNNTIATINTFGGDADVVLNDYDFAVYAVVSAKATAEGVMVESITPVEYDGFPHVVWGDGSTKKRSDLTLRLYDTNEGKLLYVATGSDPDDYPNYKLWKVNEKGKDIYAPYLVKGTDYTLTYKNNKNASVAYDESVSGNDGQDATFKRIVTDAKMPQVIVKGKGNYKSLKTTVLFDIVPAAYDADGTEALKLQLAGKKLNTKANVTFDTYKKLDEYGDEPPVTDKVYKLKAGKYNAKKGTYTGDYIMEVYKVAKNGARTLMSAKDLKSKAAAGDYLLVFKGVNNFRGVENVEIEVKDGVILSKQKFKWTKKVNWAEKVTVADFKIKATTAKKPKTDIPLVKYAEEETKAGYYIESIYDNTRKEYVADVTGTYLWPATTECSDYVFENAGSYTINIKASGQLGKDKSIFGSHSLKVEVKGTKLKASDFTIEGKAANKTVVIDYDGQPTKAPVAVALKKPAKFPVTDKSKIPMAYGSKKYQEASKKDTENNHIHWADADGDVFGAADSQWIDGLDATYLDTGVEYKATLVKSGVYNLAPTAANERVFNTYVIKITPSGKYYGSEKDGSVRLTYKRGNVDLKKAMGKIIKVTSNPVEVNVGGTNADLWMTIEGMEGSVTNPSDNKAYFHNDYANDGKQYMWEAGVGDAVLAVTYAKNKKVGTGVATIKPTKYGKKYFKGSAKVNYTIKTRTVKPIVEDYDDTLAWHVPGDVLAVVNDVVAPKSGAPKASATLYQVTEFGDKVTKLGKKDYSIAAGTYDKDKGYPVLVTAGSSGNFKFENEKKEAKAPTESYFNTFGKKAKKIVVTLSQGEASGYDAAKKGYVYTGSNIDPKVVSVTVDGQPLSIPADGVTTSSNFAVKYNNDVKVGTATATITLIRDTVTPGLSGNDAYPVGGSVKVKYKIVPHTNNKLILSE